MPPEDKTAAATTAPAEDFDAAFSEAIAADKPVATPDASGTAQDPPAGEAAAEADAGAAGTDEAADAAAKAAAAEVAAAEAKPAAAPATPAAPAAAAAPAAVEAPEAKAARLEADNAALRDQLKKAPAAPAEPKAADKAADAAEAAPAEPKWYAPTTEESAAMDSFRKEWPDQAQAMDVMVKQAAYNVAEYVFNQLAKVYNPTLERFSGMSELIEEQLALMNLRSSHSDYDKIYDSVVAWVETLPTAYKRGAKEVMNSGTSQEVAELIDEYKAANPSAAAAAASAATATPAAKAPSTTELSAAAKKAAGKLQVVGSKRTTPITPADANDFEGAWSEALRVTG